MLFRNARMTSLTQRSGASRRLRHGGTSLARLVQPWATVVTWSHINFYGEGLTSLDPWTRFTKWVSLSFRHTRSRVRRSCVYYAYRRGGPCEPDVGCILSMACTGLIARGSLSCTRTTLSQIHYKQEKSTENRRWKYRFQLRMYVFIETLS